MSEGKAKADVLFARVRARERSPSPPRPRATRALVFSYWMAGKRRKGPFRADEEERNGGCGATRSAEGLRGVQPHVFPFPTPSSALSGVQSPRKRLAVQERRRKGRREPVGHPPRRETHRAEAGVGRPHDGRAACSVVLANNVKVGSGSCGISLAGASWRSTQRTARL